MTALEEIKKALEGVTPGPWHVAETGLGNKLKAPTVYHAGEDLNYVASFADFMTFKGPARNLENARYIAAVNPAVITELLSTLESLQRDNEKLRGELAHETSHRQKLQNALAYWMPSVTEEIEISMNGRCGDDALLLVGSDGPLEDKSWGNEVLARAEAAEAQVKRLITAVQTAHVAMTLAFHLPGVAEEYDFSDAIAATYTALASTGGEHHAE